MGKFTKEWLLSALARAIRTGAQVALSYLTVGMTISEVDWRSMLSVAVVAMVYSILMSVLSGLPEATHDGTLVIDDTEDDATRYMFQVETPLDTVDTKDFIRLKIEHQK